MLKREFGVVLGVSRTDEYAAKVWLKKYLEHNSYPVVLADFGVSRDFREWAEEVFDEVFSPGTEGLDRKYRSVAAMIEAPLERFVWMDVWTEVRGSIDVLEQISRDEEISCAKDSIGGKVHAGVVVGKTDSEALVCWRVKCSKAQRDEDGSLPTAGRLLGESCETLGGIPRKYNFVSGTLKDERKSVVRNFSALHFRSRLIARYARMGEKVPMGIVVVCQGIKEDVESRFMDALDMVDDERSFLLYMMSNRDKQQLNKSVMLNRGIRQLRHVCEIVATTDIDILLPSGLVDRTYEVSKKEGHVWATSRNIPLEELSGDCSHYFDRTGSGYGTWNAMDPARWYWLGGYDERMKAWGHEDTDLHKRIMEKNMRTYVIDDMLLVHVAHPPRSWRKDTVGNGQNNENIALSKMSGKRSFLKRKSHRVTLQVTTKCTRECFNCSQQAIVNEGRPTEMTMEHIEKFVDALHDEGRVVDICIAGGEPMTWSCLDEAVEMMDSSPCISFMSLFTNADMIRSLKKVTADRIKEIRLSKYSDNEENAKWAMKSFSNATFVPPVSDGGFYVQPEALTGIYPEYCSCRGYALWEDRLYFCPNSLNLSRVFDVPVVSVTVAPGMFDALNKIEKREKQDVCKGCMANRTIKHKVCPTSHPDPEG